jgi:hypothetical protein
MLCRRIQREHVGVNLRGMKIGGRIGTFVLVKARRDAWDFEVRVALRVAGPYGRCILCRHEAWRCIGAVAGMILNGLGFSNRPLTLTPQFFTNKPLDLLFREGVRAEMFNRFKLGRTLEETYRYDG